MISKIAKNWPFWIKTQKRQKRSIGEIDIVDKMELSKMLISPRG